MKWRVRKATGVQFNNIISMHIMLLTGYSVEDGSSEVQRKKRHQEFDSTPLLLLLCIMLLTDYSVGETLCDT